MTASATLDPDTANTIRQAVSAAQAGDTNRARQLAEAGLANGGDPVALNAFLGMVHARAGDPRSAIEHLHEAHSRRPGDVTIACNLIAAAIDAGELQTGLDAATRELAFSDPSLRVARYRGFLSQSLERFEDAVEAYEHVVARAPADFESWNNLGNAKRALNDIVGAVAALQRAVALNPMAAPPRMNLASALIAAEQYEEAERTLKAAASDFPDDAKPLDELYVLYKRLNRHNESLPVIEQAVHREPDNASLQLKLGIELGIAMRPDEAERAFRKAIETDPQLADGYLGLAVNYEHTNREEEFAPLIALAEKNGLDTGALDFMKGLELRRAGRFEDALAALSRVPSTIEPERTAHLRGMLLDRLERSDEAFEAFEETARLHMADPTDPLCRAAILREELRREIDALNAGWLASWSQSAPVPPRAAPLFLVGFPRSGTTLLDTIMMGHPDIQVMEERPPLTIVEQATGGFEKLPSLDGAGIVAARERYFQAATEFCDIERPGLLVDKSPLHLNKVPLIHRLFPDARFILALRHPCDVLLSCFMSNFRLNAAMSNFLRLEDAAEFYDLTFRYWERARALLRIRVHTIFYERMIEDSEAELRPLFGYLGLDWREDVLDHRRTAATRGMITTASYSQVTEPIYKRAAGRWHRYRKHLEPVFPTLEPWVRRFGYSMDE